MLRSALALFVVALFGHSVHAADVTVMRRRTADFAG
jgi:hypothetical protein